MRRLLYGGLVFLSGMVASPVSAPQTKETPADYKADRRFKILKAFFSKADCPARHYAQAFLEAADRYDLDWRLLPSLSFVESSGGKSAPNNNMFGWNSGRTRFTSLAAGIHSVGYWLTHLPLYRGKDVDSLLATYNPDEDYRRTVKFVMRSIAPN